VTRKIIPLSSYLSAKDAAAMLSKKLGRNISPEYLTKVATSKKQPIRTQSLGGYHKLYCKEDLERVTIKKKSTRQ
jgi:hypothetical protein